MAVKKRKNILTPLETRVQYQVSGRETTGSGQAEPGAKRENEMEFMPTPQTAEEKDRDERYAAQKREIDRLAKEDWYFRLRTQTALTIEENLLSQGWYLDENLNLRKETTTGFVPV